MNLRYISNPYRNILLLRSLIRQNHCRAFVLSSRTTQIGDEMVAWVTQTHWDACVFFTMNAKSQLACGEPFSYAESLCLPWILSGDNSTLWGILRVFLLFSFLFFPLLSYPPMTSNFFPPSPLCLWHNENRCIQLSSSICLSACFAKIYFLVCTTDKCVVSTLLFRGGRNEGSQIDEHFGQHILISITKVNISATQCIS